MEENCNFQASNETLEYIDEQITFILDKARKFVEGPFRAISFSSAKVKARAAYLY